MKYFKHTLLRNNFKQNSNFYLNPNLFFSLPFPGKFPTDFDSTDSVENILAARKFFNFPNRLCRVIVQSVEMKTFTHLCI